MINLNKEESSTLSYVWGIAYNYKYIFIEKMGLRVKQYIRSGIEGKVDINIWGEYFRIQNIINEKLS